MVRQRIHFLIDKNGTICFIITFRIITSQFILNQSQVYTMRKLTIRRSQMTDIYQTFQFRKWMIQCYLSVIFQELRKVCFPAYNFVCVHKQDCKMQMKKINVLFWICRCNVRFFLPTSFLTVVLRIKFSWYFNFFFEFLNFLWEFWSNFRKKIVSRRKVLSYFFLGIHYIRIMQQNRNISLFSLEGGADIWKRGQSAFISKWFLYRIYKKKLHLKNREGARPNSYSSYMYMYIWNNCNL